MSSLVHISPIGHSGLVRFALPVKGVFGRVLCDTDGTIGYPTEFDPKTALAIVKECEKLERLDPGDRRRLEQVRSWAAQDWHLFATWVH